MKIGGWRGRRLGRWVWLMQLDYLSVLGERKTTEREARFRVLERLPGEKLVVVLGL